jgi:CrcB protein
VIWWAVALGGAVGAPCRFLLDIAVTRKVGGDRPWGTLVINLSGSAVLGALAGLIAGGSFPATGYALLGIGFCGSFTTFSTFVWEAIALVEGRQTRAAAVNVALTVVLGIALAYSTFLLAAPHVARHA